MMNRHVTKSVARDRTGSCSDALLYVKMVCSYCQGVEMDVFKQISDTVERHEFVDTFYNYHSHGRR